MMHKLLHWLMALSILPGWVPWIDPHVYAQSPSVAQSSAVSKAEVTHEAKLDFDVASVRQNKVDGDSHSNLSLDNGNLYSVIKAGDVLAPKGGYFSATNQPIWRYIVFAYKLSGTQELALRFKFFSALSSNVPSWVTGGFNAGAERFDIEARASGDPTKDQMRLMMQSLLANRFKLVVHMETRQAPVFALLLMKPGKVGPNLKPHQVDESCLGAPPSDDLPSAPPAVPTSAVGELPIVCGVIAHVPSTSAGPVHFGGRDVTLSLLASSLPTMTGMAVVPRPVIDQTGLSGTYDFTLGGWAFQAASEAGEGGPTFAEALRDQLGLKLERQTGPVEVLVIDHIEHPSEN